MVAGSATLHEKIAEQSNMGDGLPCADEGLLLPLKRSPEYRAIRPRVSNIRPIDSWQEYEHHFFVFQLRDDREQATSEAPVVVFAMHPEQTSPVSVVVVTPGLDGGEAEVRDLRQPENSYTASYSS